MSEFVAVFEFLTISYLAFVTLGSAFSLLLAARYLSRSLLADNATRYVDLLKSNNHLPISILVPAFDEQATIVNSVRSFLTLHYPRFEVVVINDGSNDDTMAALREAFRLIVTEHNPYSAVPCQEVRAAYRSPDYPNLLVVDKVNGGKADALNAGLNRAKFPLFCAVDADSLLDSKALLRASLRFSEDPELVALGGTVRVLNNAVVANDTVKILRAPRSWIERFQVIEYTRAFLAGRTAFSTLRMLLIVSGAFGLFRREDVIAVGGYDTGTVGEDMELVIRLHRRMRESKRRYRVRFLVDPICWTQVPGDSTTLRKQRDRWHRGLLEALWKHRRMFLNPRYGRIGLIAMPAYCFLEALTPITEIVGYLLFVALTTTGQVDPAFPVAVLALVVVYGLLVSVASVGIEVFMRSRYSSVGDRFVLLLAALFENLGYRQWMTLIRARAFITVFARRGEWGEMKRNSLSPSSGTSPPVRRGGMRSGGSSNRVS